MRRFVAPLLQRSGGRVREIDEENDRHRETIAPIQIDIVGKCIEEHGERDKSQRTRRYGRSVAKS